MPITAVIITRNEGHIIGTTLKSLEDVVAETIIVDSGSTDDTVAICKKMGALVIETTWHGYGLNKNMGIDAASNNWILNIDADEVLDETLRQSIKQISLQEEHIVYEFRFKNFFCGKEIRFGEWGRDKHVRLFNRKKIRWNNAAVHESLTTNSNTVAKKLKGSILHYTVKDADEYNKKTTAYAELNAKKYFAQGKKASFLKRYISATFTFINYYVLKLGFLDGKEGFIIARTTAWYTFLKYRFLKKMYD